MEIADIKAEAFRLEEDYHRALEDAALFDRLKGAAGETQRLADAIATNANVLHAAEVAAMPIEHRAIASDIRGLAIALAFDPAAPRDVSSSRLTITWEQRSLDTTMSPCGWSRCSVDSFTSLQHNTLRYITDVRPEMLPSAISELAPGDPLAAITLYINAVRNAG